MLKRLVTVCCACMVAVASVLGLAVEPVYAAPPCQSDGVYVLFARGSSAKFNSDEAVKFRQEIQAKLGDRMNVWAELGNLDNDNDPQNDLDSGEYPAVGGFQWVAFPGYWSSVDTGVNELITHLNDRAAQPACANESIVLGGYSQGADVIGRAINDSRLSAAAKQRISYVALYGDPRYYNGDLDHCFSLLLSTYGVQAPWEKGDSGCAVSNFLIGQRYPYVPSGFEHKVGSWCDKDDPLCTHNPGTIISGTHTTAYIGKWIAQSMSQITIAAIGTQAYPVGARVGDGSIIESDQGHLYVYIGGSLFWFDRNNAAQLDAFESQSIRLTGTEVYIPLHNTEVHAIEVNRDNNGNYSAGSHMPADNTFLYEYGSTQQYVVKYQHPFAIGNQQEAIALGGQDKAMLVPSSIGALQSHPPQWVHNDLLQFWGNSTVWHFAANQGFRVPSVPTRDCLSARHNRAVTLMPASAWSYFPTHATQQAACDFTHGQWLFGNSSNRQIEVMYGVGFYVQSGEVVPLGGADLARPVSDYTVDDLIGRPLTLPDYHLFKAPNTPTVYMVLGNQFQQVGSPSVRDCLMATYGTVVETIPQSFIDRLPKAGGAQCPFEGKLLMKAGGQVDYVKNGQRHWVQNEIILNCLKVRAGTGNSILVEQGVWDGYASGSNAYCPYETEVGLNFVQESGDPTVWLVHADGTKQHVGSLCVSDPYTTQLKKFHVWTVPVGETAGHVQIGDFWASGAACAELPG